MKNFIKKKIFKIQTFQLRNRRLSLKKKRDLNYFWPLFGCNIDHDNYYIKNIFNKNFPFILEIGFGFGESLIHFAKLHKKIFFLGIELYIPGICFCLKKIYKNNLNNIKIFHIDAISFLENYSKNIFFHKINIFFPDPWPKRRHYKRRMIQLHVVNLLFKKLMVHGILHITTDCCSYARNIFKLLDDTIGLKRISKVYQTYYFQKYNFFTRFKNKAQNKKSKIYEIIYQKII